MPLEKLIESIEQEAKLTAQRIINDANKNAQKIMDEIKRNTEKKSEILFKSIVKNCEQENARSVAQTKLTFRNKLLRERQYWIDKVFNDALIELQKIDRSTYKQWIEAKILDVSTTGEETIIFSKKDSDIFTKPWLDQINQKLDDKGLKGNLKILFEEGSFTNGFILNTQQFEVVVTFEKILNRLRQDFQTRIHDLLFEEKK